MRSCRDACSPCVDGARACPAASALTGCVRSSAWIWLFSSTQSTSDAVRAATDRAQRCRGPCPRSSGSTGEFEGLRAVRLHAEGRPYPPDRRMRRSPLSRGHRTERPVGVAISASVVSSVRSMTAATFSVRERSTAVPDDEHHADSPCDALAFRKRRIATYRP